MSNKNANPEGEVILKYKSGQERDIVIEKQDFSKSIFADQYAHALKLINRLVEDKENSSLKCVAFCGDRGEGKTSCMSTVRHMLEKTDWLKVDSNEKEKVGDKEWAGSIGVDALKGTRLFEIEVIDPSFFDEKHNILQIVISHLYNLYVKEKDGDFEKKLSLSKAFSEVSTSLKILKENSDESLNELHNLSQLATGIRLRNQMETLIERFLDYVRCDFLVIPIDDIDLNIVHAYKMCEEIRKYLAVRKCLVLMSVKVSQLEDVVANYLKGTLSSVDTEDPKKEIFNVTEVSAMAEKYVNKLLPVTSRINMPKAYSLMDFKIEIDGKLQDTTKEAILQLIYARTRYLFYNSDDGVAPIVPNNLRDLLNLIGLLASMEEVLEKDMDSADGIKKLEKNKRLFKSYFFSVWKNHFSSKIKSKLDSLINFDYGFSFNKEVISILKENFESLLQRDNNSKDEEDYEDKEDGKERVGSDVDDSNNEVTGAQSKKGRKGKKETDSVTIQEEVDAAKVMIESIISEKNFGYNISIGDVFYLLDALESDKLSEAQNSLIFFLKSLYSIKMYEAYKFITRPSGNFYYPTEDASKSGFAIKDPRFDHSNILQQLIGGSYFTYCPGELLSYKRYGVRPYDLRIINGKALNALLKEMRKKYKEIEDLSKKTSLNLKESSDYLKFRKVLKIAEFFILTIRSAIPQEIAKGNEKIVEVKALEYLRKNVDPWHYRNFYPQTGYYLFDIMAPFGNLINVEFTYKRFQAIDDEFFQFIKKFEGSLLRSIIEKCKESRKNIAESDLNKEMHQMLSDCSIRNADILIAVRDRLIQQRNTSREGGEKRFLTLYNDIKKSGLKPQKTGNNDETGEDISFMFLEPFISVLNNSVEFKIDNIKKKFDNIYEFECKEIFHSIFDSPTSKVSKKPVESSDNTKDEKSKEKQSSAKKSNSNARNKNSKQKGKNASDDQNPIGDINLISDKGTENQEKQESSSGALDNSSKTIVLPSNTSETGLTESQSPQERQSTTDEKSD